MEEKHSHKPLPPPAPMQAQPWTDEFSEQLLRVFPASEFSEYLGQQFVVVDSSDLAAIIKHLKTEGFDFLVDLTAVDYPQREKRFELVYELYSFARNRRVRVKARFADGEAAPSITAIHPGANWLEREAFDMFGIRFDGHPDLRRMLLPEDWQGHPLRKDSSILGVDQDWVKANLGIEQ